MKISSIKTLWRKRNILLSLILIGVSLFNLSKMKREIHALALKSKIKPFIFIGTQFQAIRDLIDSPWIGYYTDKTLDDLFVAAQFSQAQYILVPTLLDLNNINYPFVILDLKESSHAIEQIQDMGLVPMSLSPSGIILAKNPKYDQ